MERCRPIQNSDRQFALPSRACWHPIGEWKDTDRVRAARVLFAPSVLPEFVRSHAVGVMLLDTKVAAIYLKTFGVHRLDDALAALEGKFGEPDLPPTDVGATRLVTWTLPDSVRIDYRAPLDSEWNRAGDDAEVHINSPELEDYLKTTMPKSVTF